MKKMIGIFVTLALITPISTTVAYADYNQSGDVTVQLPVNTGLSSQPASTLFNLQQGTQQTLTSTTGINDTYSYIWVTNANGTPIVAIDPPKPMMK